MSIGVNGMGDALQRAAQQAMEQAGKEAAPAGPQAVPDGGDVQRFQDALRDPAANPAASDPAAAQSVQAQAAADSAQAAPEAVGDRILQGISSVSDKIQAGRQEAADVLAKPDVSQADLLRAQFALLESTTMVSAVGKTTEKITQGLKTLQQG